MASVMVLDIGHCPDDFKGFEYFCTHVALDLHFNVYFIQTTVEWLFIIIQFYTVIASVKIHTYMKSLFKITLILSCNNFHVNIQFFFYFLFIFWGSIVKINWFSAPVCFFMEI